MADKTNETSRNQNSPVQKGNRPADNARQATPASLLAQMNWQGGESAQDFLGLNSEPAPAAVAPQMQTPVAMRAAPPAPTPRVAPRAMEESAGSSWLMDESPQAESMLNHAVEVAVEVEQPEQEVDYEEDASDPLPFAPEVLDASWTEPKQPRSASKRPMVALAAGLAILGVAGFAFVKFQSRSKNATANPVELAQAPTAAAGTAPESAGQPAPVLVLPKPSPGLAKPTTATGTGRVAVDHSGKATPQATPAIPEPEVVLEASAKPASQSGPAASKPKFKPAPKPTAPPLVAEATPPETVTPTPNASLPPAQVQQAEPEHPAVGGPSKESLQQLIEAIRDNVSRGEYGLAQVYYETVESKLALASEDPLRQPLVAELQRLHAQAGELSEAEKAKNAAVATQAPAGRSSFQPGTSPAPTPRAIGVPQAEPGVSASETRVAVNPDKPLPPATAQPGGNAGPTRELVGSLVPEAAAGAATVPDPALNSAGSTKPQQRARLIGIAEPPPPSVRVLGSSTTPLGDSLGARPAVDDHHSSVPTEIAQTDPANPAPSEGPVGPQQAESQGDNAPVQVPAVANREGTLEARDVLLPPPPINGVRTAQANDMLSIWDRDTIPMEHIAAKTKVLTPLVGNVRVRLKTKEIFEGKLYAIGENAVWIEGSFGRMSLDNARIDSVEKLAPDVAAGAAKGTAAGAAQDRVRVKTAGGLVFGRVVRREDSKVTLITDAGLTQTVDAKDIESLAPTPTLIIKKDAPVK